MKQYDIIVIGAGSAGLSVGIAMKRLGFSVLMVEKMTTGSGATA